MTKVKIPNNEIQELVAKAPPKFPKYTTQILVLANQNAGGTRPKVVGQMSELIQEFTGKTMEEWVKWYSEKHPNSAEHAADKVYDMIVKMQDAFCKIDKPMVKEWVEDLLHSKTFSGLRFQEAILKKIAITKNATYRLATIEEEARGIDGVIGTIEVSIKPHTYQSKMGLSEQIDVPIIFYKKGKKDIEIEYSF